MAKASKRKRPVPPKKASRAPKRKHPWLTVSGLSLMNAGKCVALLTMNAAGDPIFKMLDRKGRTRISLQVWSDGDAEYARVSVLSANEVGIGVGADTIYGSDLIGVGTGGDSRSVSIHVGPGRERQVTLQDAERLSISLRNGTLMIEDQPDPSG